MMFNGGQQNGCVDGTSGSVTKASRSSGRDDIMGLISAVEGAMLKLVRLIFRIGDVV